MGQRVTGYEIHHGVTTRGPAATGWVHLDDVHGADDDGAVDPDGRALGTSLHGLFEEDGFRATFRTCQRVLAESVTTARRSPMRALPVLATVAAATVACTAGYGVLRPPQSDLSGLMHKSPGYAVLMLVFLLSLAGIPPTAGFLGKYYIFLALIETKHYVLAVVATLYVAVAIYYYFRLVRSMFAGEATEKAPLDKGVLLQVESPEGGTSFVLLKAAK